MNTITLSDAVKEYDKSKTALKRFVVENGIAHERRGRDLYIDVDALRVRMTEIQKKTEGKITLKEAHEEFGETKMVIKGWVLSNGIPYITHHGKGGKGVMYVDAVELRKFVGQLRESPANTRISDAAKEFGVSVNTLRRWVDLNDIPYEKRGNGNGVIYVDINALREHRRKIEEKLKRSVPLAQLAYDLDYHHNALNRHAKQLRAYIINDAFYISKKMFNRYKGTSPVAEVAKYLDVNSTCVRKCIEKYDIPHVRLGVSIRLRVSDVEDALKKKEEEKSERYDGWFTSVQLIEATKGRLTRKILTNRVNHGEYPRHTGDNGEFLFRKEDALKLIKEAFATAHLIPAIELGKTMGYKDGSGVLAHVGRSVSTVCIRDKYYVTAEEYDRLRNMRRLREVAKHFKVSPQTMRKWIKIHDIPHVFVGSCIRLRKSDVAKLERFEWERGTTTITEVAKICGLSRSKIWRILDEMEVPKCKVDGVLRFTIGQYSDAALEYEEKYKRKSKELVGL